MDTETLLSRTLAAVPRRSLRYRGFAVTVEVPDRLARLLRGRRARNRVFAERLVVEPPPPLEIKSRHGDREHWQEFAATSAPASRPSGAVADEVTSHSWYHTIELPDGSVTPGRFDHRPLLVHYGLPEQLQGERALDIGSGDGFWAFELERRGAEVTSLDVESFLDVDLPPALHTIFVNRPVDLSFRRGFEIARRRLGSQVTLLNKPVYDLDPTEDGMFDFVHAGDILLHLRDPILALQKIRAVTSGTALFADCFDPHLDALMAGPGLTRYRGGWEDVTWWSPALSTLAQMVSDAGYSQVEILTTYTLSEYDTVQGPWRAVVRGQA